jgi:hypothetical protein
VCDDGNTSDSRDCSKTKIIDTFCLIFNKNLYLDTIDDSVTGRFQQFDFNRKLEDMWQQVQVILFKKLSQTIGNYFEQDDDFSGFVQYDDSIQTGENL